MKEKIFNAVIEALIAISIPFIGYILFYSKEMGYLDYHGIPTDLAEVKYLKSIQDNALTLIITLYVCATFAIFIHYLRKLYISYTEALMNQQEENIIKANRAAEEEIEKNKNKENNTKEDKNKYIKPIKRILIPRWFIMAHIVIRFILDLLCIDLQRIKCLTLFNSHPEIP